MLSPPIQEWDVFTFVQVLFAVFEDFLAFFLLCFWMYLVKLIPKYLTFFVTTVNGIFTTIMTTVYCLHMLILYPARSLKCYCLC